jgi:hypothetical protein
MSAAVAIILPALIIPVVIVAVTAVVISVVIPTVTHMAMMFLIMRNVFMVVPVVLHKVDPFTACMVLTAMFAPVSGMARRDVQVDWRTIFHHAAHDNRPGVDQLRRRIVANIDPAVEAGLSDADRYANVGSDDLGGGCDQCGSE